MRRKRETTTNETSNSTMEDAAALVMVLWLLAQHRQGCLNNKSTIQSVTCPGTGPGRGAKISVRRGTAGLKLRKLRMSTHSTNTTT